MIGQRTARRDDRQAETPRIPLLLTKSALPASFSGVNIACDGPISRFGRGG